MWGSFFALLQNWIERTDHRRGRQGRLGRLSEIEDEDIVAGLECSPPDDDCHQDVQHCARKPTIYRCSRRDAAGGFSGSR